MLPNNAFYYHNALIPLFSITHDSTKEKQIGKRSKDFGHKQEQKEYLRALLERKMERCFENHGDILPKTEKNDSTF